MRQMTLTAFGRVWRKVPRTMPGKTRIVDALLTPFGTAPAVVEGAFGLRYDCPSISEPIVRGILRDGLYEPATHAALCAHLPAGGVFLDIGANIGAISLPVARVRSDCTIYAIEASTTVVPYLCRNIALNRQDNVTAINAFVGADDGSVSDFYEAPIERFGMNSAGPQFWAEPTSVAVRSIDALIAEGRLAPPDVIKLDIEGAEYLALEGCANLLSSSRRPRAVVFEFADWAEERLGLTPGASQALMLEKGYRLYDLNRPEIELDQPLTTGDAMLLALS